MPRTAAARPRATRLVTESTGVLSVATALLLGSLSGCAFPLDVLGVDETVTQRADGQGTPDPLADDRVEDKHPVHDSTRTIVETFAGCQVTLNKSGSLTRLDVVPDEGAGSSSLLHVSYTQALASRAEPTMPTMELVDAALKPFNDGLYAAVELAAQDGSDGSMINKRSVLTELLEELVTRSTSGTASERPLAREGAVQLAAALSLSGPAPALPADIAGTVPGLLSTFEADTGESRAIGFYTWTPELAGIFRQDRLLQSPPSVRPGLGAFAASALALGARPGLTDRYRQVLDLYAGLTNPFFHRSLLDLAPLVPTAAALDHLDTIENQLVVAHPEVNLDASICAAHVAFVPSSDSPETRLFRGLLCSKQLDASTSLIDLLIAKIRLGELDLTPTASSGFYDRQLFALETLLVPDRAPEKDHLLLTKRYKEKLVESFKTLLTERRETHVKQHDGGGLGGNDSAPVVLTPIDIHPLLPVEPFPTFYLRTARAYVFLEGVLRASLGQAFLAQARRVNEDGSRGSRTIGAELHDKICLLYGLSTVASASLGMAPLQTPEEQPDDPAHCEKMARSWLESLPSDPDLGRDPRVIVPVQTMPDRSTRAWAVIGVRVVSTEARFVPGFEPEVVSPGGACLVRGFVPVVKPIAMGKQVEVTLRPGTPPPTRDELRALCDREGSVEAIVKALEAL